MTRRTDTVILHPGRHPGWQHRRSETALQRRVRHCRQRRQRLKDWLRQQKQQRAAKLRLTAEPWQAMEEAVVGLAHRRSNLPCQDAARALAQPRALVAIADGAGSAKVSERGAQAVVTAVTRLTLTMDNLLAELLDRPESNPQLGRRWALWFVKHARGVLEDLAEAERREVRELRCTLLMMIAGREYLLWFKVGDGALVIERRQPDGGYRCSTLGGNGKGEFANETQFLDHITPEQVESGLIPCCTVTGLAAMSDGAAERLVSLDGSRVAPRLSQLLERLRQGELRRHELTRLFYEPAFCDGTSGDDRCLALAARSVTPLVEQPTSRPAPNPAPAKASLPRRRCK